MSNGTGTKTPGDDEVQLVEATKDLGAAAAKPPPPPPPPSIEIKYTPTSITGLANFGLGSGIGTASATIGIPSYDLQQVTLGYQQGGSGVTVFYNWGPQNFGQTFNHTFDNGLKGSLTITEGPTTTSVKASVSFTF